MNWSKYPKAEGFYAEADSMILTAWPNGSWSVHDPLERVWCRNSNMITVLGEPSERNIETAKEKAELAALEMAAECVNSPTPMVPTLRKD